MKKTEYIIIAAVAVITFVSSCKGQAPAVSPVTSVPVTEPGTTVSDEEITEETPPLPAETTVTSQIHIPDTTSELGGHDAEVDDISDGNKVFLVSVEPGTSSDTMNEVIRKYDLGIVYDYENFNMYALSVPSPLDGEETDRFINELESCYDFILSVEPDSAVSLDGTSDQ